MLPPLASGEQLGCYALTEPDAGSDTASIRLRAERDGDDWLLHGTKTWITNGGFADAVIVFARTGGAGAGGVSAFLARAGDGLTVSKEIPKLGLHTSSTAELAFDGLRVPDARPPRRRGRRPQGRARDARRRPHHDRRAGLRHRARGASTWPRATPRSATRSAGRSRASRACSSRSPTSRPSSRARAC